MEANGTDNLQMQIENLSKMSRQRRNQIVKRSLDKMEEIRPLIEKIIQKIRDDGDAAICQYTKEFDKTVLSPSQFKVTKQEIKRAYQNLNREDENLIPAIRTALEFITSYHEGEKSQLQYGFKKWKKVITNKLWKDGEKYDVGQLRTPIERIGVYVPGGNATLFSTALMAIAPAKVAGVQEIVVCSPPSRNGKIDDKIIVAADLAGASSIFQIGGAQAIAAMAFGTETVPKVYKIFGPGNNYVSAAKSYVASLGICAIDFFAGPSEIIVIADESASPLYIARDLVAQAEHDSDACAILLTNSKKVASEVQRLLNNFETTLCKKDSDKGLIGITKKSLSKYGAIICVDSIKDAISFSNEFAPEHLEIMTKCSRNWLDQVRNAGTILLGQYSPVAISDYIGPNHILPTGGAARYTSGINIDMFMKKPSLMKSYSKTIVPLDKLICTLSTAEGLYNQHGLSVKERLQKIKAKE